MTVEAQEMPRNAPSAAPKRARHSRAHIHLPSTVGERLADAVVNGMGSWKFIVIQTLVVTAWIAINGLALALRFDPYPFILLNLLFSTQAAYASPLILMAANRQAQKDHLRDDHEAMEVDLLYQINQQQLEILHLLRLSLCANAPDEDVAAARAAATALQAQVTTVQEHLRDTIQETEQGS